MAELLIEYTVAVARRATLAKRITAKQDGSGYDVQGYDHGYLFGLEQWQAADVADFGRQLWKLSKNPAAAVLRGTATPHVLAAGPQAEFRRKCVDPNPAENLLLPVARAWFAVDADDVAAPAGMTWLDDVPGAALCLLKLLPPEL